MTPHQIQEAQGLVRELVKKNKLIVCMSSSTC